MSSGAYDILAQAEAVALAYERRLAGMPSSLRLGRGRYDLLAGLLVWGGLATLFTLALAFLAAAVWLAEMAVHLLFG